MKETLQTEGARFVWPHSQTRVFSPCERGWATAPPPNHTKGRNDPFNRVDRGKSSNMHDGRLLSLPSFLGGGRLRRLILLHLQSQTRMIENRQTRMIALSQSTSQQKRAGLMEAARRRQNGRVGRRPSQRELGTQGQLNGAKKAHRFLSQTLLTHLFTHSLTPSLVHSPTSPLPRSLALMSSHLPSRPPRSFTKTRPPHSTFVVTARRQSAQSSVERRPSERVYRRSNSPKQRPCLTHAHAVALCMNASPPALKTRQRATRVRTQEPCARAAVSPHTPAAARACRETRRRS
eukprot:5999931-Pleurochrysis_carterae.AAC.1